MAILNQTVMPPKQNVFLKSEVSPIDFTIFWFKIEFLNNNDITVWSYQSEKNFSYLLDEFDDLEDGLSVCITEAGL